MLRWERGMREKPARGRPRKWKAFLRCQVFIECGFALAGWASLVASFWDTFPGGRRLCVWPPMCNVARIARRFISEPNRRRTAGNNLNRGHQMNSAVRFAVFLALIASV